MKWVLLFSLTMLLPMHSLAEIYQWVDEQGQMHFGSVPPRLQEPYQPGDISRNATGGKPPATAASSSKPGQTSPQNSANSAPQTPPNIDEIRERLRRHVEAWRQKKAQLQPAEASPPEHKAGVMGGKPQDAAIPPQGELQSLPQGVEKTGTDKPAASANRPPPESDPDDSPLEQAEKCAVFSGLVRDYEYRLSAGCASEICDIYRRQLEKYRAKQKQYCQAGD